MSMTFFSGKIRAWSASGQIKKPNRSAGLSFLLYEPT